MRAASVCTGWDRRAYLTGRYPVHMGGNQAQPCDNALPWEVRRRDLAARVVSRGRLLSAPDVPLRNTLTDRPLPPSLPRLHKSR